jgi:hypothetical protein
MRFRSDSWAAAEDVIRIARGERSHYLDHLNPDDAALLRATPPVQPGDTWRVRWYAPEGREGPIAGYAIGCPTCGMVHAWTTANNCQAGRRAIGTTSITVCEHSGTGSCWQWSGSAEAGTLTASPSLHSVLALGGCGFHGFLTGGVLRG